MRPRLTLSGISDPSQTGTASSVDLSVVIPVYNGSRTISALADELCEVLSNIRFEIILVNDGSIDESEQICTTITRRYPGQAIFLQLTRNFGEHNAVMAGIRHACGNYIAILDDDGQNAAQDVRRMYLHAGEKKLDVVYSRYGHRQHARTRVLGSWLNDRAANFLLKKPHGLYLSSFKVMNRFVADEIIRYAGPFPYVDGLILRVSRRIGQLDVAHLPRREGQSGYTLSRLISLWLSMSVGFSLAPLRLSTLAGVVTIIGSILMLVGACIYRMWLDTNAAIITHILIASMFCAIGIQLVALGIVGEYVGRIFMHQSGMPQHVVRYVRQVDTETDAQASRKNSAAMSIS